MTQQTINHGTVAGDHTGESLFNAFTKVNANFTELYGYSATALYTSSVGSVVQAYSANLTTWAGVTPGTGIAAALAVAAGADGAPVIKGSALGTPNAGTLTNCSGLPAAGVTGTALVSAAIGTTVQAYDVTTAKTGNANSWTAQQTFKSVKDIVWTINPVSGFEIDPANGPVQIVTLSANRTPSASLFQSGQKVLLGIDDGSGYSITWTTVNPTWVKPGGTASAPALETTGYTWVLLWMVSSTIYATEVGKP